MRIAFILDQFPRLSETYFLEQIVGLIQAGHDLDIIATIPGGQPKVHPDVERFDLLARTHYTGVPAEDSQLGAAARLALANVSRLPRNILKLLNVPSYGVSPLYSWTSQSRFFTSPLRSARPSWKAKHWSCMLSPKVGRCQTINGSATGRP